MSRQSDYWSQFEITGNIGDYLTYKCGNKKQEQSICQEGEEKNGSADYSDRNGIIRCTDRGI